ncbi:MAG: M12 family metallo-peptidase [Flavobacteriales bacterium]
MRQLILLLFTVSVFPVLGQLRTGAIPEHIDLLRSKQVRFVPIDLFDPVQRSERMDQTWNKAVTKADVLRYDRQKAAELLEQDPAFVSMVLRSGEGELVLDLERVDIATPGMQVYQASTNAPATVEDAAHYQGAVRGRQGAIAAISVFRDEVMGIISDAQGQMVLGRFEDDRSGLHVLYREDDLRVRSGAVCGTPDGDPPHGATAFEPGAAGERTTRCVRFYWEVNYDVFLGKGSVTNATNYVTGLFNQSAILYANDGIDVTLSEVFVWDVPSPYTATSTSALLDQFGDTRTSFNGDLAHLIGYAGGGGIAWRNVLCNNQASFRMAYSGINSNYANVPTYSWSVEVITHEQGHNLASSHTHACVWNGNNTAIDGCGPAAGYTEGSCPDGPLPSSSVGGTIMSYCHLTSSTIKFANGFGPQPTALIVGRVNSSTCLGTCGTTCDAPTGLIASSVTTVGANLSWAAIGAVSYTLQWKLSSASTWTTVTGLTDNTYALGGLSQTTSYDFRVLADCGTSSSPYSASVSFTTASPCPDALEPNNSTGAAADVPVPVSLSALIASASDADYYRFILGATGNITISLSNLAGDYDVRLLNSGGTQLAISQEGGTSSENISYADAPAGTYFVHVYGYNGAFSTIQCYSLSIFATGQGCVAPSDLSTTGVVYNGATVQWNAVNGAVSYNLQWREGTTGGWNTVPGVTGTSYSLTGLNPSTDHNFRVQSICNGGSSQYSGSGAFTTPAAPCEVAPTAVIALKVLLDGPYRTSDQMMTDSLRQKGLIPLQEPYTAMGWAPVGNLVTTAGVLAVSGSNAVTDWVLVELRNTSAPYAVVEARVGLVQRDGDVVGMDGVTPLGFCVPAGPYRVSIRHRNHLGCMSGNAVTLNSVATALDLTQAGTATYGTNARKDRGARMTLWSGNTEPDVILLYTGADNDRDAILSAIGGLVPTNSITGYHMSDVNMDGRVKYTGTDNDKDMILVNIGGVIPTNSIMEQLP